MEVHLDQSWISFHTLVSKPVFYWSGQVHLQSAKGVLRYMKYTRNFGPVYQHSKFLLSGQPPNTLYSWADSDHGMCLDSYRSTSGQLILLNRAAIYWKSSLQPITATSTTEAEFISLSENAKNAVSFRICSRLQYSERIIQCHAHSKIDRHRPSRLK